MGIFDDIGKGLVDIYNVILQEIPTNLQVFLGLFLLVMLIVAYAIFIWKFYRFVSKKNILGLNLNKYNRSEHPFFTKLVAIMLYLLEYIIILPFIIFFWFSVFTLFLIFLTRDIPTGALLIISATIISAIRVTSYYSEDLSKDLAKMLPFTLLAVAITQFTTFEIQTILFKFSEIPSFISHILIYLGFIIGLETILRFFDFLLSLLGLEDVEVHEEN